jgi:uncharacterized protein YqfA (UPF0365 family)
MTKRPSLFQQFVAVAFLKVPLREVRRCLRRIEETGLDISYDALVAHHMAGGRMTSWIEGLIYARENGIELDVTNGAARDLLGAFGSKITLTEHIRLAASKGCRDMRGVPFDSLQKK